MAMKLNFDNPNRDYLIDSYLSALSDKMGDTDEKGQEGAKMQEQMTKQDAIETLEIFRNDYTREGSAMCRAINIALDALRQPAIEPVREGDIMNDIIYKRAAYEAIKHEADTHMLPEYKEAYEKAARIIDQMPAIEPEVRHGRWVVNDRNPDYADCTNCGLSEWLGANGSRDYAETLLSGFKKFCPNCGARMGCNRHE